MAEPATARVDPPVTPEEAVRLRALGNGDSGKPTPAAARLALEEDAKARIAACQRAIQQALAAHRCELQVVADPTITPDGRIVVERQLQVIAL